MRKAQIEFSELFALHHPDPGTSDVRPLVFLGSRLLLSNTFGVTGDVLYRMAPPGYTRPQRNGGMHEPVVGYPVAIGSPEVEEIEETLLALKLTDMTKLRRRSPEVDEWLAKGVEFKLIALLNVKPGYREWRAAELVRRREDRAARSALEAAQEAARERANGYESVLFDHGLWATLTVSGGEGGKDASVRAVIDEAALIRITDLLGGTNS